MTPAQLSKPIREQPMLILGIKPFSLPFESGFSAFSFASVVFKVELMLENIPTPADRCWCWRDSHSPTSDVSCGLDWSGQEGGGGIPRCCSHCWCCSVRRMRGVVALSGGENKNSWMPGSQDLTVTFCFFSTTPPPTPPLPFPRSCLMHLVNLRLIFLISSRISFPLNLFPWMNASGFAVSESVEGFKAFAEVRAPSFHHISSLGSLLHCCSLQRQINQSFGYLAFGIKRTVKRGMFWQPQNRWDVAPCFSLLRSCFTAECRSGWGICLKNDWRLITWDLLNAEGRAAF